MDVNIQSKGKALIKGVYPSVKQIEHIYNSFKQISILAYMVKPTKIAYKCPQSAANRETLYAPDDIVFLFLTHDISSTYANTSSKILFITCRGGIFDYARNKCFIRKFSDIVKTLDMERREVWRINFSSEQSGTAYMNTRVKHRTGGEKINVVNFIVNYNEQIWIDENFIKIDESQTIYGGNFVANYYP